MQSPAELSDGGKEGTLAGAVTSMTVMRIVAMVMIATSSRRAAARNPIADLRRLLLSLSGSILEPFMFWNAFYMIGSLQECIDIQP